MASSPSFAPLTYSWSPPVLHCRSGVMASPPNLPGHHGFFSRQVGQKAWPRSLLLSSAYLLRYLYSDYSNLSCSADFWRAGMLGSFFSPAPSPSACPQKEPPGCLNRKKMKFRNSLFHCSQTTRVYPNSELSSWLWAFLYSVLLWKAPKSDQVCTCS